MAQKPIPNSPIPISRAALAAQLAERVLDEGGRVAIDAAVPTDARSLATAVADHLTGLGRPVIAVHAANFLRPRSIRLETGADDPEAGYHRWVDFAALRREVLDRLVRDGAVLPSLWSADIDRATRAEPVQLPPSGIVIVDGPLLLRTELVDAYELRVHLRVSEAAMRRRLERADADRVIGAWSMYREWDFPEQAADVVVGFENPDRPVLLCHP